MIPNYEPQLRPTYPQATTNPNYDQLRQKQTHPKNVAIATNYPTTNPNYDQLRPLRRLATTTAPPLKGVPVAVGTDRVDAEKQIKAKQPKTGRPEKKNPTRKKPLATQTITACPGQTGHPKSTITTATHTGQASTFGDHPRARHTGTDKRPSGTHPRRSDRASPQAT